MRFFRSFTLLVLLSSAGCSGVIESKPQPRNTPVIGEIILASQQNEPYYAVVVPVSNIRRQELKAKVTIKGSKGDVLHPISGFTAKLYGSTPGVTLCRIKQKRTATIYGKIEWRIAWEPDNLAEERGIKRFSITPEQTNEITIK